MSATLHVEAIRDNRALFGSPPPMLRVDARQYPVTTHFARATPDDHLLAAYRTVVKIHCRLPAGGVLLARGANVGWCKVALLERLVAARARAPCLCLLYTSDAADE